MCHGHAPHEHYHTVQHAMFDKRNIERRNVRSGRSAAETTSFSAVDSLQRRPFFTRASWYRRKRSYLIGESRKTLSKKIMINRKTSDFKVKSRLDGSRCNEL
jgi:hypothetical protein